MPNPPVPAEKVPAIPPKDVPAPSAAPVEADAPPEHEGPFVALDDFMARVGHGAQLVAFKAGQEIDNLIGRHLHKTGAPVRPVDPKPAAE